MSWLLYKLTWIYPILYNGTKEKHSSQATMPQHYPTKTHGYKIIGVKRKIILYNRDQIFQIEYIESDKVQTKAA